MLTGFMKIQPDWEGTGVGPAMMVAWLGGHTMGKGVDDKVKNYVYRESKEMGDQFTITTTTSIITT